MQYIGELGFTLITSAISTTVLHQPRRRFLLSSHVEVGDDQNIDQALCQLRELVQQEHERSWCKRRYGYYESKGTLGRKRKKMKRLRSGGPAHFQPRALKLYIGYRELFESSGPEMAAGR